MTLARRGLGPQAYRGVVTVRLGRGSRRSAASERGVVLARGRFSLPERAARRRVALALKAEPRGRSVQVEVRTRGTRGEPVVTSLRLGR